MEKYSQGIGLGLLAAQEEVRPLRARGRVSRKLGTPVGAWDYYYGESLVIWSRFHWENGELAGRSYWLPSGRLYRQWVRHEPGDRLGDWKWGVGDQIDGTKDCRHIRWEEVSQVGLDLSNFEFRNSHLAAVKFSGANLQSADFRGTSVWVADFKEANLKFANFSDSYVSQCEFNGADFQGAILKGAYFDCCDFSGAKNLNLSQVLSILRPDSDKRGHCIFPVSLREELTRLGFPHKSPQAAEETGARLNH